MGAEGAANIIFKKDILNAINPNEERAHKIAEYNNAMVNPYVAASRGYVDDIILPNETRQFVIAALESLQGKKVSRIARKHGNIPL